MPKSGQQLDGTAQALPQRCLASGRPQTAPHCSRRPGHKPALEPRDCIDNTVERPWSAAGVGNAAQQDAETASDAPIGQRTKRPQSPVGALQPPNTTSNKSRPGTAKSSGGRLDAPLHATNPALARLRQELAGLVKLTPVSLACLDDTPVQIAPLAATGAISSSRGSDAAGGQEPGQHWKDVEEMTAQEVAFTYAQARQAASSAARAAALRRGGKSRRVLVPGGGGSRHSGGGAGPSCPPSPDGRSREVAGRSLRFFTESMKRSEERPRIWDEPATSHQEALAAANEQGPPAAASAQMDTTAWQSCGACTGDSSGSFSDPGSNGSDSDMAEGDALHAEPSMYGTTGRSVFGVRAKVEEDELTKAHRELERMKDWLEDREAHIKEESLQQATTTSSALSKDVAASMSNIRAGTDMLRTQRHMYEEALARMQSAPGFKPGGQDVELSSDDSEQDAGLWFETAKSMHKGLGQGQSRMHLKSRAASFARRSGGSSCDSDGSMDSEQYAQQERLPDLNDDCPHEEMLTSASFKARKPAKNVDPACVQLSHSGLRPKHLAQAISGSLQPWLTSLNLGGNLLDDASIGQLATMLAGSSASTSIRDLDLSANTLLTWRCCQQLAAMLGPWLYDGATGVRAANPLRLQRVVLQGVQLGDKGALLLVEPLRSNSTLQALNLSRCSISDAGGAGLCSALAANSSLQDLNLGWNALAHSTAAALERALRSNRGLRSLCLSHNGLSDMDGACVLSSLCGHAAWRHVDLSSNCLEGGAALTACHVIKSLRSTAQEAAATAAAAPSSTWAAAAAAAAIEPRDIVLDGNPLGFSGARCLMHALAGSPPVAPVQLRGPQAAIASPVAVSILGCSLIAMEKGFRPNLQGGQAAAALVPQTLQLSSAVVVPGKARAGAAAAAAAPAAPAPLPPGTRGLVVTEGVAGLDLVSPGGQYALDLTHPASRVIMEELLDLKNRLQELAASAPTPVEDLNPEPQRMARASAGAPTAGGSRRKSTADTAARAASGRPSSATRRRASASDRPGSPPARPGSAAAAAAGRPGSAAARPGSAAGRPGSAAPQEAVKRQGSNSRKGKVETITIAEIKLDGKQTKLEHLLQRQPWLAARQRPGDDASDDDRPSSPGGSPSKAKGVPRHLEFSVKAAALLVASEQRVVPEPLMQWVLQVMRNKSSTEIWKLHITQLLCTDWLLLPAQASAMLCCFDKELGREEELTAAQLLFAQLAQPMHFWMEVLPALNPLQQQRFKTAVGPLMSLDRVNLAGSYNLNLGHVLDQLVALRLQRAALQEDAYEQSRYFSAWRNAFYNGRPLREDAIVRLQLYAMPHSGTLQLDYVTYKVPYPTDGVASTEQMQGLLKELRTICSAYQHRTLAMRREYLPQGKRQSEEEATREATKARAKGKLKGALAVMGLAKGAALSGSTSAAFGGTRNGSAGSTPAEAAISNTGALADAESEGPWWSGCGFDGFAMLLRLHMKRTCSRQQARSASPNAAAAAEKSAAVLTSAASAAAGLADSGDNIARADASRPATANKATRSASPPAPAAKSGRSTKATKAAISAPEDTSAKAAQARTDALLVRMLRANTPAQLAAAFSCLSDRAARGVLLRLSELPNGVPVAAKLLCCQSPAVAARFLLADLPDASSHALLPFALRQRLEPHLTADVKLALSDVGAELAESQRLRSGALALCVRRFVAAVRLDSAQLTRVVGAMGGHAADRCTAVVCAWARIVDRSRLVEVFEALSGAEQLDVMRRLGFYHVWSTLARPEGLHFMLDLKQAEQRDVAREVVKTAVRKSLAERARTGQRVKQLENLMGSGGKQINDPEDEKLWLSIESKHSMVEFDYARTWEQELHHMAAMVRRIQRHWREVLAARAAAATAVAAQAEAAERHAQLLAEQEEAEAEERAIRLGAFGDDDDGSAYSSGDSSEGGDAVNGGRHNELPLDGEQQLGGSGVATAQAAASSALQAGFMALAARLANSGYPELAAKLTPRRLQQGPGGAVAAEGLPHAAGELAVVGGAAGGSAGQGLGHAAPSEGQDAQPLPQCIDADEP